MPRRPIPRRIANPAAGGVTATTPCWGSSSASFDPPMPAWAPTGNTAKAAGGTSYGVVGSPADNGLLVAHDYEIVFCAPQNYKSYTTAPNIYRLWVDPTTCTELDGDRRGRMHAQARQLRSKPVCRLLVGRLRDVGTFDLPDSSTNSLLDPGGHRRVVQSLLSTGHGGKTRQQPARTAEDVHLLQLAYLLGADPAVGHHQLQRG